MRRPKTLSMLTGLLLAGTLAGQDPNELQPQVPVGRPGGGPVALPVGVPFGGPVGLPPGSNPSPDVLGGGRASSRNDLLSSENKGPRLDFSFRDLPLVEVIRQIQAGYLKATGKNLNVMVPSSLRELAATNLVEVDLKQVTVGEVLTLLGRASQQSYQNPYSPGMPALTSGYTFELISGNEAALTYLLKGQYPPKSLMAPPPPPEVVQAPPPPEVPKTVVFFPLDPYLDRFTVEDITTAAKTGWDLAGYKDRPTMKYHEETKLLVVSGSADQVRLIEQVLRGLASQVSKSPRPVPTAEPQAAGAIRVLPPTVPAASAVPASPGVPIPPTPVKP